MKHRDQDRLLNELLAGEELSTFRKASLDHTLAALHQRRRTQRNLRAAVLGLLPLLVALAFILARRQELARSQPDSVPVSSATTTVEFINDDELFALFPDRPLALIGKPGNQQLVFLGQPGANRGIRGLY